MVVKKNIRFLLQAIRVSILSAVEYKISFMIQAIFMFINNGFFLIYWSVVFRTNTQIQEFNFNTILYLWSIPVISYGITHFFFGGVTNINTFIITGQMDSYMLQPKDPLINVLTSKCNFSAFGDLIYGIVIGLFATQFDLKKYILVLLFGMIGAIFFLATEIILRSLSVWIKDTEKLATRYSHTLLTTFSNYPEQVFGHAVKIVLYTVVPVAYIVYLPIQIIIEFNLIKCLVVVTFAILYISMAIIIFHKAMRSYESGNTISMRM